MTAASPRCFILIAAILIATTRPVLAKEKIVAYVPNWVDLKSFSETIDYAKITHINIAFENPINDRGDLSFHQKNEILITKAHANNVKVLVSIGGGAASGNKTLQARYFELLSAPKRAGFAAKLADVRRGSRLGRSGRGYRRAVDQQGLRVVHPRPVGRHEAQGPVAHGCLVTGIWRQERPRFRLRASRFRQRDGL